MSVSNYNELKQHVGHKLKCVTYGGDNVVIECHTCDEIIVSYDDGDMNDLLYSGDILEAIVNQVDDENLTAEEVAARANFVIGQLVTLDPFYDLIDEIMAHYEEGDDIG